MFRTVVHNRKRFAANPAVHPWNSEEGRQLIKNQRQEQGGLFCIVSECPLTVARFGALGNCTGTFSVKRGEDLPGVAGTIQAEKEADRAVFENEKRWKLEAGLRREKEDHGGQFHVLGKYAPTGVSVADYRAQAASKIKMAYRRCLLARRIQRVVASSTKIQMAYRRCLLDRKIRKIVEEKAAAAAAAKAAVAAILAQAAASAILAAEAEAAAGKNCKQHLLLAWYFALTTSSFLHLFLSTGLSDDEAPSITFDEVEPPTKRAGTEINSPPHASRTEVAAVDGVEPPTKRARTEINSPPHASRAEVAAVSPETTTNPFASKEDHAERNLITQAKIYLGHVQAAGGTKKRAHDLLQKAADEMQAGGIPIN